MRNFSSQDDEIFISIINHHLEIGSGSQLVG